MSDTPLSTQSTLFTKVKAYCRNRPESATGIIYIGLGGIILGTELLATAATNPWRAASIVTDICTGTYAALAGDKLPYTKAVLFGGCLVAAGLGIVGAEHISVYNVGLSEPQKSLATSFESWGYGIWALNSIVRFAQDTVDPETQERKAKLLHRDPPPKPSPADTKANLAILATEKILGVVSPVVYVAGGVCMGRWDIGLLGLGYIVCNNLTTNTRFYRDLKAANLKEYDWTSIKRFFNSASSR